MIVRPVRGLLSALLIGLGAMALPVAGVCETAVPAAATAESLERTMKIDEVINVLRAEGLDYGNSLEDELFPGRGGADWKHAVNLIYDAPSMRQQFALSFQHSLEGDPTTLGAAQAFFNDARGQRILTLEIEARRALLDQGVEDAARARAEDMMAKNDPRMPLLHRFAEVNDLVEANVQGALNANLAFYKGLAATGGMGTDMTEDQMLSDVWGQEDSVRTETENWLFPYLALAYGPLPDADLQAYIDFSATPAGQKLNAALFAGFDAVFTAISLDLGRAAGKQMSGQDI